MDPITELKEAAADLVKWTEAMVKHEAERAQGN